MAWCPFLNAQPPQPDLSSATIEELLNIRVTTVGKREQPLSSAAASVYVITQEEIRRSGLTSVAEVLRLAPGVHVAQISGDVWAISIRGFNYQFADKLLVMIDGRTIFSPIFSGVFWDLHDLMPEDIERIEVVRGPGGTLWGANAMNGVINIITKRAQDTQGVLVTARAGSLHGRGAGARFGGKAGNSLAYRIYVNYLGQGRNPASSVTGGDGYDSRDVVHSGFRLDASPSLSDTLMVSGDIFRGDEENTYPAPLLSPPYLRNTRLDFTARGGSLLGRWSHNFHSGSDLALRVFYDRAQRAVSPAFAPLYEVFDVDFQQHIRVGERHRLIYGGGFRTGRYSVTNSFLVRLYPEAHRQNTENIFLQDEISLVRDRLWLVVGSKFEHNPYAGFEPQPELRLRCQLRPAHMVWASVSRAVTIPNDIQQLGYRIVGVSPGPGGLPLARALIGNAQFKAQRVLAFEAGYRGQPMRRLAFDLSIFFNGYAAARLNPGTPYPDPDPAPHLVLPLYFANGAIRHNYGLELSGTYALRPNWQWSWGYAWLLNGAYPQPGSQSSPFRPGDDPKHQFQVRSRWSPGGGFEFDTQLFYVSRLPAQNVPSYVRFDTRVGWKVTDHLEISAGGQNLFDPQHLEYASPSMWSVPTEVGRTAYVKFTWRF